MHDMSSQKVTNKQTDGDRRLKLGVVILLLNIILPVAGVPVVTSVDLSETMTTSFTAALLITAEILGIVAIAVMGKSGFA